MTNNQLLIETDVLCEYLCAPKGEISMLRTAMQEFVCYTTMINALELFRAARAIGDGNAEQRMDAVMSMLYLVRVLGFNARAAAPLAAIATEAEQRSSHRMTTRDAMILGLASTSKLTILTRTNFERFTEFGIVPVIRSLPSN